MLEGLHPDVEIVAPEGNFIRKEEITEINLHAVYRPYEARAKVYIFLEADSFNAEAANAFLKTLEEPPAHVHFILVTDRPETAAAHHRLPLPAGGVLARARRRRWPPTWSGGSGWPRREAALLARVSGGNLDYARELATSESARRQRDRLLDLARGPAQAAGFWTPRWPLDELMATVEARAGERAAELEAELEQALEWAGDARTKAWLKKRHEDRIKRQQRRLRHAGPADGHPGASPAGTATWRWCRWGRRRRAQPGPSGGAAGGRRAGQGARLHAGRGGRAARLKSGSAIMSMPDVLSGTCFAPSRRP